MSYIGKEPSVGNFVKLDAISVVNGQAGYTMQSSSVNFTPESANHMLVSLNGVIQAPISSFTVSGSTITFASALSTGDVIDFIMVYGNVLDIGTPSDNTVSTAKLVDTSVTAGKLATDSVIEAKIQNDAVTRDKINAISTSSLPSFEAKGTSGVTEGYIQLNCAENSQGIKLKSPPHSAGASYTLTFPNNDGNANEVLTTDGSGVLSWGAVSSDFVKLYSITASNSSAVSFDGYFSSTYDHYILYGHNITFSSSGDIQFRVRQSNADVTTDNYNTSAGQSYTDTSPTHLWIKPGSVNSDTDSQDSKWYLAADDNYDKAGNLKIWLPNPLSTTQHKWANTEWQHQTSNGNVIQKFFGNHRFSSNSALSGISIMNSGGNTSGKFILYGIN